MKFLSTLKLNSSQRLTNLQFIHVTDFRLKILDRFPLFSNYAQWPQFAISDYTVHHNPRRTHCTDWIRFALVLRKIHFTLDDKFHFCGICIVMGWADRNESIIWIFETKKTRFILPAMISIQSTHISRRAGGRPLATAYNRHVLLLLILLLFEDSLTLFIS